VRLLLAIGAIAAAIAAALVALSARDLRRTWAWPDEMAGVQQSDPWPPDVLRNVALPDETLNDWLDNVRVHSRFAGGMH
jgi:hypothetical protein